MKKVTQGILATVLFGSCAFGAGLILNANASEDDLTSESTPIAFDTSDGDDWNEAFSDVFNLSDGAYISSRHTFNDEDDTVSWEIIQDGEVIDYGEGSMKEAGISVTIMTDENGEILNAPVTHFFESEAEYHQWLMDNGHDLEPHVQISNKSTDEIGLLSNDISQLYHQLHGTIITLEQEVSRYSDAENKKIEFLQSVAHEMKTPLASANALLEGIIYEVSPYHEDQKKYLEECREFLQKTIQLTKESLNLSEQYKKPESVYNLAEIIKETSNLYGVIFMVKQLSYREDVPGNISILTKKHLLSKVLSNLFSNASSYTKPGGYVEVTYCEGILTIFNTCEPLQAAQVNEIFKPLMTQNTAEHATGLGLFIVKQLLRQLKIDFEFVPSTDGTGMAFRLWLLEINE